MFPTPSLETPSLADVRDRGQECFGKRPCHWQIKIAIAFLKCDRDIVCIAGTGMGKTMTFWLPLLFQPSGIQIVVTPLNQLAINAETATWENFRAIEDLKYCAVIVSPEQLMKPGGEFKKLLIKPEFTSRIIGFVFDEAHCITSWGDFRPEYKELQRLRYILPCQVPFMIASATLTPETLTEVKKRLHMRSENLLTIHMSTDRPNIQLGIRKIKYMLSTYADLGFLIPLGWKEGDPLPPKFLIFFDNIQEAIAAAKFLQSRLPAHLRHKIKWFNSDMTTKFKEEEVEALVSGDTMGFCTTESFRLGMDVSNICLVLQWRATCSLSTIWQRWGRAVRDRNLQSTAILFAEREYFDDVRQEKQHRKEAKKHKAGNSQAQAPAASAKRRRIDSMPSEATSAPVAWEDRAVGGVNHEDEARRDGSRDKNESDGSDDKENAGNQVTGGGGREVMAVSEKVLREMMKPSSEGQTWNARKKRKVLDPAMDCLINANFRAGFQCRRKVFHIHFNNASSGEKPVTYADATVTASNSIACRQ
ncbi:hypothetical protein PAXINDRAFT_164776 [Paxillus involutus ATCC 200175]|uniref:DNA 3'-5' helicase n=1 Tax=Paxillus involutus ATCC 200175 TaxID=664439 RepID=A0A0C9T196_PAXIN|nr:hypothetical protein PAXINDRAFT_164776 [Paxillus involutus ATCC 200175]